MDTRVSLLQAQSLTDFRAFLSRAARVERGAVRAQAEGSALSLWVPVLTPVGLLDATPTVLGLRVSSLAAPAAVDAVVPVDELLSALETAIAALGAEDAAAGTELLLPQGRAQVAWTGIVPPRGGWEPAGELGPEAFQAVAEGGIAEVAAAVPGALGTSLVSRVRGEVWGRTVAELDGSIAGSAFALLSLGFLVSGQPVRRFRAGAWERFSTPAGHVLVRSRRTL